MEIGSDPVLPSWCLQALWLIVDCPQDPTFPLPLEDHVFCVCELIPSYMYEHSRSKHISGRKKKNKMSESGGPVPSREAPRPGSVLRAPGKDTHLGKWSIGLRSSNGTRDSSPGSSAGESFVQGTPCRWISVWLMSSVTLCVSTGPSQGA